MRVLPFVVAATVASSGCSVLKLTAITGPGCCEHLGESVKPVAPYAQRTVVQASVVAPHPDRADVRFACAIERKPDHVEVTTKSIEYGAGERLWLGFWALGAGVLGTALLVPAFAPDGLQPGDVAVGTIGAILAADAAATAGLAIFMPTTIYEQRRDAPASWSRVGGGCPRDLQVVVDGAAYDVGADLRLTGDDAVAVANAVQRGTLVEVDERGRRAQLAFTIRPYAGPFMAEAVARID